MRRVIMSRRVGEMSTTKKGVQKKKREEMKLNIIIRMNGKMEGLKRKRERGRKFGGREKMG